MIYWTDFHDFFFAKRKVFVCVCVCVVNPDQFFDSSRDIAMATNFGQIGEMTFIQHLGI